MSHQSKILTFTSITLLISLCRAGAVPEGNVQRQGSFDEPGLDRVEPWVLSRVADPQQCHSKGQTACEEVERNLARYRQHRGDRREVEKVLASARESALPQSQLLAALCLIRLEEWAAAEQALARAMRDRNLRQEAHYLRARALMSQGLLEAASREASELAHCARRESLPPAVDDFVAAVRRRLDEEGALGSITSVIEQPVEELEQAVAPLRGLDPSAAPPPGGLDKLLKELGATVDNFFHDFSDVGATELLWQTRLGKGGKPADSRNEEFYYLIFNRNEQGRWWLEEYRGNRAGKGTSPGGLNDGYMVTSGFASSLVVFHPRYQPGMAYRYLGRQRVGDPPWRTGQWTYVVGFAQRPGHSDPLSAFRCNGSGRSANLYLQGIAWISVDEGQVLRLRTDLLDPAPLVHLNRETSEVDYRPYRFASSPRTFWLPSRVRVNVEWGNKRLLNAHNFTQYRLFKVDTSTEIKDRDLSVSRRTGFAAHTSTN